jgi:hypothetical protein
VAVRITGTTAEVSWANPGGKPGDRYRISPVGAPNAAPLAEVDASPARIANLSGRCVQVIAVRGSYASEPTAKCAE